MHLNEFQHYDWLLKKTAQCMDGSINRIRVKVLGYNRLRLSKWYLPTFTEGLCAGPRPIREAHPL